MWSLYAVAKAHDRSESRKLVTGNFKWTVITSKVNPWATLVTIFYIRPKLSLLTLIEIDIWNPTSTNMNSSLSKISQYCHNFLKSLISGLRQYLIWSGWTELAPSDPRKVGSHLSLGEQVGGVWVGQSISNRVGHSHFSYSDVPNQISEKIEWSKWVQLWKTRYIRIFNVLHRDCLYIYQELQLSLIMVTSNQYFCLLWCSLEFLIGQNVALQNRVAGIAGLPPTVNKPRIVSCTVQQDE